jgi:hypothetical protein
VATHGAAPKARNLSQCIRGDPGDDAVGLGEALNEPGHDDDLAAIVGEEGFGPGQAFFGEPDVAPEAQHKRAAAEPFRSLRGSATGLSHG